MSFQTAMVEHKYGTLRIPEVRTTLHTCLAKKQVSSSMLWLTTQATLTIYLIVSAKTKVR